ncbi:fibroblast growth factor 22 isoform 1-T1 [Theristicus caerulescens]
MRRGGPAALAACLAGALAVLAGPGPGPGPGAGAGSAAWGGRRPPRSYGHLEGDVRWRRLFSATRFFLRIDGGGGVEGTRWRERPGSIVEIRSVRVGVVAIRAVHTGFYLAMNKQGRLYGCSRRSLQPRRDTALPAIPPRQSRRGAARGVRPPRAGAADIASHPHGPDPAAVALLTASLQGLGQRLWGWDVTAGRVCLVSKRLWQLKLCSWYGKGSESWSFDGGLGSGRVGLAPPGSRLHPPASSLLPPVGTPAGPPPRPAPHRPTPSPAPVVERHPTQNLTRRKTQRWVFGGTKEGAGKSSCQRGRARTLR